MTSFVTVHTCSENNRYTRGDFRRWLSAVTFGGDFRRWLHRNENNGGEKGTGMQYFCYIFWAIFLVDKLYWHGIGVKLWMSKQFHHHSRFLLYQLPGKYRHAIRSHWNSNLDHSCNPCLCQPFHAKLLLYNDEMLSVSLLPHPSSKSPLAFKPPDLFINGSSLGALCGKKMMRHKMYLTEAEWSGQDFSLVSL